MFIFQAEADLTNALFLEVRIYEVGSSGFKMVMTAACCTRDVLFRGCVFVHHVASWDVFQGQGVVCRRLELCAINTCVSSGNHQHYKKPWLPLAPGLNLWLNL